MEEVNKLFNQITIDCINNNYLIEKKGNTTTFIPEKYKQHYIDKYINLFPNINKEEVIKIVTKFINNG